MNLDKNNIRFLGLAYLVQFVGSLLSDPLFGFASGTGTMSEKLVSISNNLILMRLSILAELITSLGIIVMTIILYIVLQSQSKIFSLLALSLWLIEAILLIISSIAGYSLIPLALEYIQAGTPVPSYMLTLGSLILEMKDFAASMHMMFFAIGGIIWYYLFYQSRYIPRALSLWGLVLISIMPIDVLLVIFGFGLDSIWRMAILFPLIAYLPFEGVMGFWFIFKGIASDQQ